jgi:hypothetical protein
MRGELRDLVTRRSSSAVRRVSGSTTGFVATQQSMLIGDLHVLLCRLYTGIFGGLRRQQETRSRGNPGFFGGRLSSRASMPANATGTPYRVD